MTHSSTSIIGGLHKSSLLALLESYWKNLSPPLYLYFWIFLKIAIQAYIYNKLISLSSVIRVRASPMVRWSRKSCFFPWASPRLNSITKWTLTFIQTWLLQAVEITKRYHFPYEILHSMSNFWCWIVVVKLLVFGTSDKRWNQLPANSRRAVHETRDVSAEEDLKSSKHMEHSETTEDSGLAGTQSCSNFDLAMIISLLQSTVIWPCPSSKYSYN